MNETREQNPVRVERNGSQAPSTPSVASMVEEGSAFMHLTGGSVAEKVADSMGAHTGVMADPVGRASTELRGGDSNAQPERVEVVVIGAGQAGLSVGYHLSRLGVRFVILEANQRIGDPWRNRWDSLRLFTPSPFDGLDGMRFPKAGHTFPNKDEMGDYLEAYAARFSLPVRTGVRVDRVVKQGDRYLVTAGAIRYEAENVVVAMSSYQDPWTPPFARELDAAIVQLHSSAYRSPSQLREGGVLIVGAGNSGSEIAMELARKGHGVWLAGRDTGHIPFRIEGVLAKLFLVRLVLRVVFHRILTRDTPIGRKVRPQMIGAGGPLIRVKPKDLAAVGVRRAPRVAGVRDGRPVLDDSSVPEVTNVIWCTGFRNDFSWIERPVFDDRGEPIQIRGLAKDEPGLYFVGIHFQYAMSSTMIHGVGRDARFAAEQIAARRKAAR